jgi:hypothetical protein
MRDRNLERNIQRLESFLDQWRQLNLFLERGFQGENFTPEEEAAFLELKSVLAQEHEMLMTLVPATERDDKALRLLNLIPSLQAIRELTEGMPKKINSDWHNSFMGLQALLGRLRGRQAQLAGVSTFRVAYQRVFANPVVVVIMLVAAGYGVYKFTGEWAPKIKDLMEKRQ